MAAPTGTQTGDALDPVEPMPAPQTGSLRLTEYLPANCRTRGYVNVAGLLDGQTDLVRELIEPLLDKEPEARAAANAIQREGFDPYSAVQEVAFCENPDLVAVRFQGGGGDPLAALQSALNALGEGPGRIEQQGSLRILTAGGDDLVALCALDVLVFADEPRDFERAYQQRAGAAGFARAARLLVWVQDRDADLTIAEQNATLQLQLDIHDEAGEAAERALRGMRGRLQGTPLNTLATALGRAKVLALADGTRLQGVLYRHELGEVLRGLHGLSLDELDDLIEGRYGQPPPPPPTTVPWP